MNPSPARALLWVSAFLVIVGPIATSYAAAFIAPLFAAALSFFPAVFGRRRARLVASVILAVSVLVAFTNYPGYRRHMEQWAARAQAQSADATHKP